MESYLTFICYAFIIFGLYKLFFKKSGNGCLLIILALIFGNIFITDKSQNSKRETSFSATDTIPKRENNDTHLKVTNYRALENKASTDNYNINDEEASDEETVSSENVENLSPSNSGYDDDGIESNRSGAICKDGTESDATGRGACSHHGGVSEWKYED